MQRERGGSAQPHRNRAAILERRRACRSSGLAGMVDIAQRPVERQRRVDVGAAERERCMVPRERSGRDARARRRTMRVPSVQLRGGDVERQRAVSERAARRDGGAIDACPCVVAAAYAPTLQRLGRAIRRRRR